MISKITQIIKKTNTVKEKKSILLLYSMNKPSGGFWYYNTGIQTTVQ